MNYKELFIGTDLYINTSDQKKTERIYLDSAASNLALRSSQEISQEYLNYYANAHTKVHAAAKFTTELIVWAENTIKNFLGADDTYSVVFLGNGVTFPLNRLALGLSKLRPEKDTVMISSMEHHSNDLPHRVNHEKVMYISGFDEKGDYIGFDLAEIEQQLESSNGKVNYVAITGASNVSGEISPYHEIAKLAHQYDAYIIVDGAQLVAHASVSLVNKEDPLSSVDFFVFSGHKIYTPGSPGVLIGKKEILAQMEPIFYGGGMVSSVTLKDFTVAEHLSDKEHAGTLNIPGIISLGCTINFMQHVEMEKVYAKEQHLINYLYAELSQIPEVILYPNANITNKVGVICLNLQNIPHELTSLILNDYFGIAVRNECFCSHPFVKDCLVEELWDIEDESAVNLYRGMVRVSLGLYTTEKDLEFFVQSIKKIIGNIDFYRMQYELIDKTNYKHKDFDNDLKDYFDIEKKIKNYYEKSYSS
ncbi:aminotransferase class V-fold PLP-dependent enzyme [Chryseobacterium herbae]|uniref:Aminotransferase class V-fold PLP-dependent enzyme n=1 Tax=Chryseobacterium herbae TaxID=2976476 RepID=A0ABT2IYB4_9FLAO|nr:aminotransferase class V-fold PLP-dependent enzyme [Chryseobacterium sp. pc1-10]MCT2563600.1 aminotransferase class V-fold PLP-dependent enzyme [Chryseobacterium sp. pc1-10]